MERNLLIAFDDSENAMRAVEQVARSFSSDSAVTLFHVAQDSSALCNMNSPELIPLFKHGQSEFCSLEDKKRSLVQAASEKAKQLLVDKGFKPERVTIRIETAQHGVARDIIQEADNNYDVLVLGKRGISGIKAFLFGGTTQKVIQGIEKASLFIVN
ncbi:MAG: universal stress protein [Deltaproteobacteria bacterium]|nr:universal stress protein [Deltaproteobacteria bacterium]